jgi:GH15 family glucan-1,4-alpha-glucosidase
VLRQHYETDALDASTLLAGSFKFLAHDDARLRNTVLAVANELTENGFALRYRTDETDDGLSGKEGTFLICSFWVVSALAIVGEMQRARDLMERLLRIASPLGLYAEEYDPETETSGEVPAGLLPSRIDRGCGAHDRAREARGALTMGGCNVVIIEIRLTWGRR